MSVACDPENAFAIDTALRATYVRGGCRIAPAQAKQSSIRCALMLEMSYRTNRCSRPRLASLSWGHHRKGQPKPIPSPPRRNVGRKTGLANASSHCRDLVANQIVPSNTTSHLEVQVSGDLRTPVYVRMTVKITRSWPSSHVRDGLGKPPEDISIPQLRESATSDTG
jgi:hypothetical protein